MDDNIAIIVKKRKKENKERKILVEGCFGKQPSPTMATGPRQRL
jgi:hypothetical protein